MRTCISLFACLDVTTQLEPIPPALLLQPPFNFNHLVKTAPAQVANLKPGGNCHSGMESAPLGGWGVFGDSRFYLANL